MRVSGKRVLGMIIITAIFVSVGMRSAWSASDEEVAALRKQVAELNAKIAQMEQDRSSLAGTMVGAEQVPVNRGYDPFAQMEAMQEQMNNLMTTSFGQGSGGMGGRQVVSFNPGYDLKGTDKGYVVTFDMPGMDKSKINVEVKDGVLYVSGERASSEESKGDKVYRQERSFGYFSRTIPLPKNAKPDTVQAKYDNGVLTVTIDKKEDVQKKADNSKKIEVK